MKSIKELLKEKRDGSAWDDQDVHHFVQGVVSGSVSSAQAGAFLMAACIHDLTARETAALTTAMADSGIRFGKGLTSRPRIDKHSTGGVGDKVSLLLAPLVASCGITVPMISGRGLGHTGGTVDKLESIRGFRTDLSMPEMEEILGREHLVMAAQSPELAPADRILYALRDVTGTVENIGLITASILSKKFAEGLDGLVMNITVGSGAFMTTIADAHRLGQSLQATCVEAGLPLTVVFTRMDRPLGRSVGNWVEVVEAEEALQEFQHVQNDLKLVTIELASQMLVLGGKTTTSHEARAIVEHAWTSGAAWERFHRMIRMQGGSWQESVEAHAHAATVTIPCPTGGVVGAVDPMAAALAVMKAGGGRLKESDRIDPVAGVVFHQEVGSTVAPGQPLATVSASRSEVALKLAEQIVRTVQIGTAPAVQEPPVIIDVWEA